jgi:hypothetical protein
MKFGVIASAALAPSKKNATALTTIATGKFRIENWMGTEMDSPNVTATVIIAIPTLIP